MPTTHIQKDIYGIVATPNPEKILKCISKEKEFFVAFTLLKK